MSRANASGSSIARQELAVVYRSVKELKPSPRNPRTHSRKQLRQIAASLTTFGFTNPVLVGADGTIIAGHGRVEAAKLLGMQEVPTIRLDHMTPAQKRAYVIADNKLAENAGWDRDLLALEFEYILDLEVELDLTVTGFETAEIDAVTGGAHDPAADALPETDPSRPSVSQFGDLWCLGPHRLLCADARSQKGYGRLLGSKPAQMVFTDPPYNVTINGHVCGLGKAKHEPFVMAAGEMSEADFVGFLNAVLTNAAQHSIEGSIHYVCMDWRHAFELLAAARPIYTELKNVCVWNKDNGGLGSLYRSKHELVFVFKKGDAPHINNIELGRHGRYRTNVWDYPGVNSFRRGRLEELSMHPTVKPVALVADAIKDCSKRSGVILDPFAGSGTIFIAAEQTGRRAYAMELEPKYVDVALRRWQTYAGEAALHGETGLTFDRIAERRGPTPSGRERS